jgi:hypothetical protein
MAKKFFTERDIEDMFKNGIMSLETGDDVVLTELAYEKAASLGMRLTQGQPDNPPCAPVRPYISSRREQPVMTKQAAAPAHRQAAGSTSTSGEPAQLHKRISSAVSARLGTQVDPNLLDVIIKRVLNTTGVKNPLCCSAESGAPRCAPSSTVAPRV